MSLRFLSALLLLAIVAIWGWTFVVVKDAIEAYGVIPFLAVRFALAWAVLAPFACRARQLPSLKTGMVAGIALAGAYLLQTWGLEFTTASNSGLITGLFLLFAPLYSLLLFGLPVEKRYYLAAVVSMAGLALLVEIGFAPVQSGLHLKGDLLTLGCAAFFGLHVALLDRWAIEGDTMALTVGQLFTAALTFSACWLVMGGLGVEKFAWPDRQIWIALAITSLIATSAAFFIQTLAQKNLSVLQTSAIIMLEPLFAVAFGWWLHGDSFKPLQWLGAGLILAAAAWVELGPKKETPKPLPQKHAKP